MPMLPRLILVASWVLVIGTWVVMAFWAKKDVHRQTIDEREPYSIPFVASILLIILPQRGPLRAEDAGAAPLFAPLVPLSPGLAWASALMALAGLGLALWARLSLDRNWSSMVALKDEHELIVRGPYAHIRHPIYTALILLFAATAMANRSPLALAAVALMALSCWIKLRAEEALMSEAFPEAYPAYMARTRRLVPWLV